MRRMPFIRTSAALVSICMVFLGFVQAANAGVIGTQAVAAPEARANRVEAVQAVILSEQVSAQLVALGVDPAWATERVSSMTDEELAELQGSIDRMPAGAGAVEIVGVVFIVLLILEFTGVIDIFKKPEKGATK